jgi:hypothetical protein
MKSQAMVWIIAALLTAAGVALAHHSFAAEFDANKPVTLKGTVTKLEWTNPHIWVYLDATDDQGNQAKWQCEGGAPNALRRNGWTRDSLKEGDQITIQGALAKDGTKTCNARSITLANGRRVFAGSADDGGPRSKE